MATPTFLHKMKHFAPKPRLLIPPTDWMPARSPLKMPTQNLGSPFKDSAAPPLPIQPHIWLKRILIIAPATVLSVTVATMLAAQLSENGYNFLEWLWIALITATFFWISFVVCLAAAGTISTCNKLVSEPDASCLNLSKIAILVPIYNEDTAKVFSNIFGMMSDLEDKVSPLQFTFFVLSDSQDPTIVAAENQAMLQAQVNSTTPIYYRRRPTNQDYKTGNLAQWVRNWGGSYNAMLVLDADSYMSAGAILTLANTLASNSHLGLVQGGLQIYQGKSHFARLQQFSSMAFGALPARGLAFWSGSEGNFFGHNAIIRTNAFAACAGLPTLRTRSQQQIPIFSHDFVEAALIRRAGWGVRILPNLENSFEECPETLVDYIQRDRRWCHGNMQHLRILGTKGLHPISRFHLFHNALGYLMSPAWFALILIWLGLGFVSSQSIIPPNLTLLSVICFLLFAPKLAGALLVLSNSTRVKQFGGRRSFLRLFLIEIAVTTTVAPILMIHQTISVFRAFLRSPIKWGRTRGRCSKQTWATAFNFHKIEICLGLILLVAIGCKFASVWLLPIAISLSSAPIVSKITSNLTPNDLFDSSQNATPL